MYLKDLIRKGEELLSVMYPEGEAREMVFAYLEDVLGTKRHTHIVDPGYLVNEADVRNSIEAFERMAGGEPLQYVTGKAWFYGREFKVSPDVLIPRPETELLCREVVQACVQVSNPRILDLCTGSGCIAWTLSMEMQGSSVTAVDISEAALSIASGQQFSETGATSPMFVQADVLGDLDFEDGRFDIIVSNPPYVMDSEKSQMRVNVLDHEPHLAIFVPDDDPLLFYKALARHSSRLLSSGGYGIVEINEALGQETAQLFEAEGFRSRIIKDLYGKDRFVAYSR